MLLSVIHPAQVLSVSISCSLTHLNECLFSMFDMASTKSRLAKAGVLLVFFYMTVLLTACDRQKTTSRAPEWTQDELFPGGENSVNVKPFPSFMMPSEQLQGAERVRFFAGKALANQPWVKAPTITTARDGLGPLYNARSCLACHLKGGRGRIPVEDNEPLKTGLVRVSLPGYDQVNGSIPLPRYGDQIQTQSIALNHQLQTETNATQDEVQPEAYVYIRWSHRTFEYPDGEVVKLQKPEVILAQLNYGDLPSETLVSLRNTPPIQGVGLLGLISQKDINSNEDPEDKNGDGISGRVNQVWNSEKKELAPGRFGWKANRTSVRQVTAAAFAGDIGISNPIFPHQPCMPSQQACNEAPNGNDKEGVELPEKLLKLTTHFTNNLGVAKRSRQRSPQQIEGRELFYQVGCSLCHRPSYTTIDSTDEPHLSKQQIWPYTDLLLHDMGPELADGRSDYKASGSEWRTAPLWGVGLSEKVNGNQQLLHDGRANSVEEAILWHGGEAEEVKRSFIYLNRQQRAALLTFVESL